MRGSGRNQVPQFRHLRFCCWRFMDRPSLGPIMRRTPAQPARRTRQAKAYRKKTGWEEDGPEEKSGRKKSQAFREMTSKKKQEEKTLSHRQFLTTFRLPMTTWPPRFPGWHCKPGWGCLRAIVCSSLECDGRDRTRLVTETGLSRVAREESAMRRCFCDSSQAPPLFRFRTSLCGPAWGFAETPGCRVDCHCRAAIMGCLRRG